MTRRYLVAATVLVATAVTGCSGPQTALGASVLQSVVAAGCSGAGPPAAAPDALGDPAELTVAMGADTSYGKIGRALIAQWTKDHPQYPARLVEQSESTDLVHANESTAAQNGVPGYDVMLVDIPFIAEFAQAGLISPLNGWGFRQDDFFPAPWQAGCYQGRLYAVPYTTDAGLFYCRYELCNDAPRSWADVTGLADRGISQQYGLVTQLDDYEGLTVNALEAIWNAGGHFVDDQAATLDQRARDALAAMVHAVVTGRGRRGAVGSTDFQETACRNTFTAGKAAYMRNWPGAIEVMRHQRGAPPFDQTVLPWPSVLGGWSLALSAGSAHPAAAVALIKYLTSEESERELLLKSGEVAARSGPYDAPDAPDYAGTVKEAILKAKPRPATPYYAEVSAALHGTLSALFAAHVYDEATVQAGLNGLNTRLQKALTGR